MNESKHIRGQADYGSLFERVNEFDDSEVPKAIELRDLKKMIKPLGFKVRIKTLSFGKTMTYVHVATGQANTGNVYSGESIKIWQPLFDKLKELPYTQVVHDGERVTGHLLGK